MSVLNETEDKVYYPLPAQLGADLCRKRARDGSFIQPADAVSSGKGQEKKGQPAKPEAPTSVQLRAFVTSLVPRENDMDAIFEAKVRSKGLALLQEKTPKKQRRLREAGRLESKVMTARERRAANFFALPRSGLTFAMFRPLNELWLGYMRELLGDELGPYVALEEGLWALGRGCDGGVSVYVARAALALRRVARSTLPSPSPLPHSRRQVSVASQKLLKADLTGAEVTVTAARAPALVGLHGIVVHETQEAFRVVSDADRTRVVPKRGCVFRVELDYGPHQLRRGGLGQEGAVAAAAAGGAGGAAAGAAAAGPGSGSAPWVTLYGDHLCFRAHDRAVRKFKAHDSILL